jgi:hypothetical protein
MLDNQVAPGVRTDLTDHAKRAEVSTPWVLGRVFVLLFAAAAFLALGALTQVLANHAHTRSIANYYYADAVVEAFAYGLAAAAFFVGWAYAGRARALREYSLPLMLAFLGAASVTAQWIIVLLNYIEQFSMNAAFAQSIRHLVDVSAVLQFVGWGAVAAALAVTFKTILATSSPPRDAPLPELQWWHHGPTRLP